MSTASPVQGESIRDQEFRYLDENERVGWLDARCEAISSGRDLDHCWKDYCLRKRSFMAWLHRSFPRVEKVGHALGRAQINRLLKIEVERQANRDAHQRQQEIARRRAEADIGI